MTEHTYRVNTIGTLLVKCSVCHERIGYGHYRVSVKDWKVQYTHRKCCPDDVGWRAADALHASREADNAARREAAYELLEKWGTADLSDYL
jgi:hypothetical protein